MSAFIASGIAGSQIALWSNLYRKRFNLTLDLSGVQIPDHKEGFDRLLIVAKGMTCNKVYDALAEQFPCWRSNEDLDAAVSTNDRHPNNGTYAVWVCDRVEADEENKNQSANYRQDQKCTDVTLIERMLYELMYFGETQKHLDIKNVTLCSGSWCSNGRVPLARWFDDKFYVRVHWCHPDHSHDILRARSVVSLPATQTKSAEQA